MTKNRTEVADIDRSLYDFTYGEEGFERLDAGITPDIVREISAKKDEPQWMLDLRLKSLEIFNRFPDPTWGPSIEGLDMDNIVTYVKPNTDQKHDWERCPTTSRTPLSVWASRRRSASPWRAWARSTTPSWSTTTCRNERPSRASSTPTWRAPCTPNMPTWCIHEYFMKLVPPTDHKFAALHGAVWSGGSFVYVPKGVKLSIPLQTYFRLNAKGAGQFEHTLIIVEEAPTCTLSRAAPRRSTTWRTSTPAASSCSWARVQAALLDHRKLVEEHVQPQHQACARGRGRRHRVDFRLLRLPRGLPLPHERAQGPRRPHGASPASPLPAPVRTSTPAQGRAQRARDLSSIETKRISKSGGISTFRSVRRGNAQGRGPKATVSCQSLMLDDQSRSDTIPAMDIRAKNVDIGHEATIGRISDDKVFYLMSRGMSEEDARAMIVSGFADPVSKELPLEYAVEMNNLIKLEMEGAIG